MKTWSRAPWSSLFDQWLAGNYWSKEWIDKDAEEMYMIRDRGRKNGRNKKKEETKSSEMDFFSSSSRGELWEVRNKGSKSADVDRKPI